MHTETLHGPLRGWVGLLTLVAGAYLACARPLVPPAIPPAAPAPPAFPAAEAEAPPPAPVEAPAASSAPTPAPPAPRIPRLVRVGLATDLESVTLPCCDVGLEAEAGGRPVEVVAALRVAPATPASAEAAAFRLQVAALKDQRQAEGLAARLARSIGAPADAVFDAGTDLYRVRVGRYPTREAAEAGGRGLAAQGVRDAWVVSERNGFDATGLRLSQAGQTSTVPGRWLAVRPAGAGGMRVGNERYRGRILVYLNDRGRLNLINEVTLEDYLRGVVPREMGPNKFGNLEALKAQTVAARTYTLNNLGEFRGEGYDICATPRCQVYGGLGSEHALTDRAIAETTGQVLLYQGELVDALYSSTCGGHTEDVDVIFPLKHEPYLQGVPCLESGGARLAGRTALEGGAQGAVTTSLLPPGGPRLAPSTLQSRLGQLARLAGITPPPDRLASLRRAEVRRFIGSQFDLALDARMFATGANPEEMIDDPPAHWTAADLDLAAALVESGLLAGRPERAVTPREIERTLFHLAVHLGVVRRAEGRFLRLDDAEITLRDEADREVSFPLAAATATFEQRGRELRSAPLTLLPGDPVTLFVRGQEVLAVGHRVDPGRPAGATATAMPWVRFRSDSELARLVETRYPGLDFHGFEILSRGVSGRVGALRLLGGEGRSEVVVGLPIRWTLDLPDTLFTARRLEPAGRESGWQFTGRGWGHGVGMCQVGAFGMAVRGHTYEEILHHYYTGVEIATLSLAPGADVG